MCLANEIEWSNIDGALPQTKSPHLEAQNKEPNWCLRGIASHLSLTLNMIKTPKDNGGFIDQKFSRPPASTIRLACPYRYKHAGSWLLPHAKLPGGLPSVYRSFKEPKVRSWIKRRTRGLAAHPWDRHCRLKVQNQMARIPKKLAHIRCPILKLTGNEDDFLK